MGKILIQLQMEIMIKKEEAETNPYTSGYQRVKFSFFSQRLAEVQDHSLATWKEP